MKQQVSMEVLMPLNAAISYFDCVPLVIHE